MRTEWFRWKNVYRTEFDVLLYTKSTCVSSHSHPTKCHPLQLFPTVHFAWEFRMRIVPKCTYNSRAESGWKNLNFSMFQPCTALTIYGCFDVSESVLYTAAEACAGAFRAHIFVPLSPNGSQSVEFQPSTDRERNKRKTHQSANTITHHQLHASGSRNRWQLHAHAKHRIMPIFGRTRFMQCARVLRLCNDFS